MSLVLILWGRAEERFPRVSGDEPMSDCSMCLPRSFSPRERG